MAESLEKLQRNTHLKKIASLGGQAKYKKYGHVAPSEELRKHAWEKWWEQEGQFKTQSILKPRDIEKPKMSVRLAEFAGIMIGDGGISNYFISVSLNSNTDKSYGAFVTDLIGRLFKVKPKIYKRKNKSAIDIVVHRKALSEFCVRLGLKNGNKLKQGLDIPEWIKKEPKYAKACLRGLLDTDGSFFEHKYLSKGKKYSYLKISFSSCSPELILSVHGLLTVFCIKAEIAYNGMEVRIESQTAVKNYLRVIGTNNPKHLGKYANGEVAEWLKAPHC